MQYCHHFLSLEIHKRSSVSSKQKFKILYSLFLFIAPPDFLSFSLSLPSLFILHILSISYLHPSLYSTISASSILPFLSWHSFCQFTHTKIEWIKVCNKLCSLCLIHHILYEVIFMHCVHTVLYTQYFVKGEGESHCITVWTHHVYTVAQKVNMVCSYFILYTVSSLWS